jgi:DNA-binding response OmpR family regulator
MHINGTILVVDDDALSVQFITLALYDEGYRVRAADDLSQARAEIALRRPNLVLLDVDTSGMMGTLLVQDLHKDGLSDVPIVIITDDVGAVRGLPWGGIADCLLKPFDLDELLACVTQFLPQQRELGNNSGMK